MERRLRGGEAPEQKSGQQKAREAMDREREKARLKRREKEETQKDRLLTKDRQRTKRRDEQGADLDKELDQARRGASPAARRKADAKASDLAAPAPKERPTGQVTEALARKLFELLDSKGKGQVAKKDVLLAIKKQAPVRRLFGLPASSNEDGGSDLQSRLMAIQDAFEGGSGLGELSEAFEKILAGGAGQAFGWDAFLAGCREQPMQSRAVLAAALLPREHSTGPAFVPTATWTVVPEGAACPPGLEYKMDMETGRTLGRLMPTKPGAGAGTGAGAGAGAVKNGRPKAYGASMPTGTLSQTLACK